ncbi:transmembrane protein, putative (macronuclear) [Tetrahymena thermophila SB210]|uniref:Transmembrane protein, putative n=1 Tax=Tetrahymena thermophila (strain SB210) TaxID=312017 RepID=W7X2G1_TETTS|nr:transmembrane protein, putative [Tetrahymena thermophila SB210]EWS73420.1 transmembrane protein, putative [Tetrahymena thermophila SB210]|eukprot:XP_012654036.1 transmembrane protein, putative [Tetrahymena thermophila SB210]
MNEGYLNHFLAEDFRQAKRMLLASIIFLSDSMDFLLVLATQFQQTVWDLGTQHIYNLNDIGQFDLIENLL